MHPIPFLPNITLIPVIPELDTHHTMHRMMVIILMFLVFSRWRTLRGFWGVAFFSLSCKIKRLDWLINYLASLVRINCLKKSKFTLGWLANTLTTVSGPAQFSSKQTYVFSGIFEDDLGSLNFIALSSLSQYGLCLCNSAPRKQPSRRLRDKPTEVWEVQIQGI